jgi:hypothetical protein
MIGRRKMKANEWDYVDFSEWLKNKISYDELVEMLVDLGKLKDEMVEFEEWWKEAEAASREDWKYEMKRESQIEECLRKSTE